MNDLNLCYINSEQYILQTWEIRLMDNKCTLTISFELNEKKLKLPNDNIIDIGKNKDLTFISNDIENNEIRVGTNGKIVYTIKFQGFIKNKQFDILNKSYISFNYNYHLKINNIENKFKKFNIYKINNQIIINLNSELINELYLDDILFIFK